MHKRCSLTGVFRFPCTLLLPTQARPYLSWCSFRLGPPCLNRVSSDSGLSEERPKVRRASASSTSRHPVVIVITPLHVIGLIFQDHKRGSGGAKNTASPWRPRSYRHPVNTNGTSNMTHTNLFAFITNLPFCFFPFFLLLRRYLICQPRGYGGDSYRDLMIIGHGRPHSADTGIAGGRSASHR